MQVIPNHLEIPLFKNVKIDRDLIFTPEAQKFYVDGDILFEQGEPADNLIVILRGCVRIFSGESFVVERGPLDIIGEQAFINEVPRSATAIAQGTVHILCIPRHIVDVLRTDQEFTKNLSKILSSKLSEATEERGFRYANEQLLFHELKAHVSPEIANRLLTMGVNYGDPRYRNCVVLFSDIRSFTEKSLGLSPEQLSEELGIYLDATVKTIHTHEGLVDKFIGDAVMAIWGYVSGPQNIAEQAFACAQEMIAVAKRLEFAKAPIEIGVGLSFGQVFMGNIGSRGKRQFTVLGTPVNLAARCETLTKEFQASIVVSEEFFGQLVPATQLQFAVHQHSVKGLGIQTLYSLKDVK